jgi:hypothetical protein
MSAVLGVLGALVVAALDVSVPHMPRMLTPAYALRMIPARKSPHGEAGTSAEPGNMTSAVPP